MSVALVGVQFQGQAAERLGDVFFRGIARTSQNLVFTPGFQDLIDERCQLATSRRHLTI